MPTISRRYVLGFAMDTTHVLLIRKNRHAWQSGHLNGIGGHIEGDESPPHAMQREFREEAGIDIHRGRWQRVCRMFGTDWEVVVFTVFFKDGLPVASSPTDEQVERVEIAKVGEFGCLSNVPWLLAMCQDSDLAGRCLDVKYPEPL